MRMKTSLKLLVMLAICLLSLGAYTVANRHPYEKSTPVVFDVQPESVGPNQSISLTVVLDAPSATGVVVTIGCTDPYAFTNLPTEVIVESGESQVTFTATTSSTFTRWAVLSACANGGAAIAYPSY